MTRKSEPPRVDEKTDAPESMADHVVIQNTVGPHCNWLVDYDAIRRVWNSFGLCEFEVESGIDGRKTKVWLPIKTVDDHGRIVHGEEYWSKLKPLLGHGVENNPKFCQFVWDYQISIVRNKPSRVSDIVSFLPRLSHFVSFSEGGVILPALHFSEGVSYTPRELFDTWMLLSECAIFGRKQIGEPFARLSVSELPVAKFDISKERVTFEQGQESLPLTFYDVLIVSPYDVDRFDCQTGKIRPIAPAAMLDGEGNKSTVGRPAKFSWDGIVDQLLVRLVEDGDFETQAGFICWVQSLDPDHSPDEKTIRDHFKRYVRFMNHVKKN